ncbi:MAG TPA: TetR/AcrR family transcriptional regulator [Thermomicrobiales bacterium]|nr:TetR/AcrR family transcriptional regulator [Thermomicrobiales bacterium]
MEATSTAATRPRSHRRGSNVRAAVLAAALAELAEAGYAALTVDNVAQRAGVHKTTVYRRWPDRERLVADALTDHIAAEVPIPDTGAIDADLREHARALVRWLNSPTGRAVIGTLVSDAGRIPDIAAIKHRFFDDRFHRAEPIIQRAIARGELPVATDPSALVKAAVAPIYLRLLVTAEPIDDAVADQAARAALAAARAGALGPAGDENRDGPAGAKRGEIAYNTQS